MGNVNLSEEALAKLLNDASEAGVKAAVAAIGAMPQAAPSGGLAHLADLLPKQQNEEEAYAAAMKRPVADRTPRKERRIECVTIGNPGVTSDAATFTAIVVDHPRFPNGIVTRLEDYKEPEFTEANLPNGMKMNLKNGVIDPMFRDWRWHTFLQADLKRYVGSDAGQLPRAPVSTDKAA